MMWFRILKHDFARTKGTTAVVLAFVFLAALLMAGGINVIVVLNGALDALFEAARVPDVVQMHAGDLNEAELQRWAESSPLVDRHQIVEMVTVDNDAIRIGAHGPTEAGTVMDISIVPPNRDFDLLLDTNNARFEPRRGEIGVPVYYALRDDLSIDDTVTITAGTTAVTYRIAAFIRDAQMNPSIIHSKRFVVHDADYRYLRRLLPESEYLIAFRLDEAATTDPNELITAYQNAGLPQSGPIVDRGIFRTLNALSDGIVAAVIILLGFVLIVIAVLCLRFILLSALEEDFREIGVMKAIGMRHRDIRRIYLVKYLVLSIVASVAGYVVSFPLTRIPTVNVSAYLGSPATGSVRLIAPAVGVLAVVVLIVVSCRIVLRRVGRISSVEALRGNGGNNGSSTGRPKPLMAIPRFGVSVLLGLHDARRRFRLYAVLCCIFVFATFIIIVPIHFLNTITAPSFISYMGIGRSDLRIDLRHTDGMDQRYDELLGSLRTDPEVSRFAPIVTAQYRIVHSTGETDIFPIQTGNVGMFPLDYLAGMPPSRDTEIALSYRNAQDLDLGVGDALTVRAGDEAFELTVSGIYQDVTNGGRTAKAMLPYYPENVLWYTVAVDLADGVPIAEKAHAYSDRFAPARVTDIDGYMRQTLGTTIERIGAVAWLSLVLGLGVSALITSLFLQMLIRKDALQIWIQRSVGFALRHIRRQYTTTTAAILAVAIVIGTIVANTVGQRIVGVVWSFMGAAHIDFVVEPLTAYLGVPILFALVVVATARTALSGVAKISGEQR